MNKYKFLLCVFIIDIHLHDGSEIGKIHSFVASRPEIWNTAPIVLRCEKEKSNMPPRIQNTLTVSDSSRYLATFLLSNPETVPYNCSQNHSLDWSSLCDRGCSGVPYSGAGPLPHPTYRTLVIFWRFKSVTSCYYYWIRSCRWASSIGVSVKKCQKYRRYGNFHKVKYCSVLQEIDQEKSDNTRKLEYAATYNTSYWKNVCVQGAEFPKKGIHICIKYAERGHKLRRKYQSFDLILMSISIYSIPLTRWNYETSSSFDAIMRLILGMCQLLLRISLES